MAFADIAQVNFSPFQQCVMKRFQSICMVLGILAIAFIAKPSCAEPGNFSHGGSDTPPIISDDGFIFVDGEYVSAPYTIEWNEDGIKINERVFTSDNFDLSSYQNHGAEMWSRPGMPHSQRGEWPGQHGPNMWTPPDSKSDAEVASVVSRYETRRLFQEFGTLGQGAMIFLRSDAKPIFVIHQEVQHDLLKQLLAISETPAREAFIPPFDADKDSRETWQQVIDAFQPTPSFIERASQRVAFVDELQSAIATQLVYQRWSEDLSYPLTMLALVLVVVGLGNLMGSAHEVFSVTLNREDANNLTKHVIQLLVIMALMSAIDLIWTVMAHQSGSMRELNPLGSKLIDDTSQLIAFKLFVTGLSIGLLFWLRRLPLTRKATWWCCLTMTLLTVRWLSFHSMLV